MDSYRIKFEGYEKTKEKNEYGEEITVLVPIESEGEDENNGG